MIVFILIAALGACALDAAAERDYDIPDLGLKTASSVVAWTEKNIRYEYSQYYVKTPIEVYTSRAGDCGDRAVLAMYLTHRAIGSRPSMVVGLRGNYHAWIESNGIDYEPQEGRTCPEYRETYTDIYEIDYYTAMKMAESHAWDMVRSRR